MGRVRYATRNIIFGFLGSGATTLLNFILRQVFITHLGDTLLGVQDLYSAGRAGGRAGMRAHHGR